MNEAVTPLARSFSAIPRILALPAAVTGFLWLTSANDVSLLQAILTFLLLYLPWQSYSVWRKSSREQLPIFSIIAFMYWLYYALAFFWAEHIASELHSTGRELSADTITATLALGLLGVACLWLGMKSHIGQWFVPRKLPDLSPLQSGWNYIRLMLVVGSLLNLIQPSSYALGEGGRQMIIIFLTLVPTLAFVILFRAYLRGESSQVDKILMAGFLLLRLIVGLSSGWLGAFVWFVVICSAVYISERKKIPHTAVILVLGFALFFQAGKPEFRRVYWTEAAEASMVDRVSFWVIASLDKWGDALSDPSGTTLRELLNESLSRASLLTQSANVLELTPSIVPYQYGRLYSYVAITLIPRFVWPDKPSVNEANQFYQTAYGLTDQSNLSGVSISVGTLTEGYISFGWFGAAGVMFLLGIFFDFYQNTFLARTSGMLMNGIGVILLPQLMTIESQLAVYVGGITQQILFLLLILLPVIRMSKSKQFFNLIPNATAR